MKPLVAEPFITVVRTGGPKRPRGYGLWAFKINGSLEFFQGTYGNTVKMAKEYAREILRDNTAVIKVQP